MNDDQFDSWLNAEARKLPRELVPGRDLWPAIERRILAAGHEVAAAPATAPQWWRWAGMAAAIGVVAIGALLALRYTLAPVDGPGPAADRMARAPEVVTPPAAAANPPSAGVVDALGYASYAPNLVRTRDALLENYAADLQRMSPRTRDIVEQNLATIQQSLVEIRQALAADSSNIALHQLLAAVEREELALLSAVKQRDLQRYDL